MDNQRLAIEAAEMQRLFPGFSLWKRDDGAYYWEGSIAGLQVRITYPVDYPLIPPAVDEYPHLATGHRLANGLCLMGPGEWNANFTAATMVGIATRFIHDHLHGLD